MISNLAFYYLLIGVIFQKFYVKDNQNSVCLHSSVVLQHKSRFLFSILKPAFKLLQQKIEIRSFKVCMDCSQMY